MLSGKNILLITPSYHGYQDFLKSTLEKLDASVVSVENKAFKYDPLNKGTQWFEALFCRKKKYVREKITPFSNKKFDACLFINLFSFHPSIIENLRIANPHIKCILYIWDNIRGYAWKPFFKYFDEVFTFDPVEAKELTITYLPNFYPDIQVGDAYENKFDLHFVGSLQAHRLTSLERISTTHRNQKKNLFFYLHLPAIYSTFKNNKLVYAFACLYPHKFKGYKRQYRIQNGNLPHALIHDCPLKLVVTIQTMAQSHCVIDLPYPSQTGSTHRVVQALALGKKVLTTNKSVIHDSFYHPDWIKIIVEPVEDIDWPWIYSICNHQPDMTALRMDNWLLRVFSVIR
jgi:hypothetical protein